MRTGWCRKRRGVWVWVAVCRKVLLMAVWGEGVGGGGVYV